MKRERLKHAGKTDFSDAKTMIFNDDGTATLVDSKVEKKAKAKAKADAEAKAKADAEAEK